MRLLGLLLPLILVTSNSFSCICNDDELKKRYDTSEFVFIGLAIRNIACDSTQAKLLDQTQWGIRVSFKIERVIKGDIKSSTIAIIQDGNSCSMTFGLGKRYMVFGSKRATMFVHNPEIEESQTWKDTINADTLAKIMEERRLEALQEQRCEEQVRNQYEIMINTSLCSSFYEKSKLYRMLSRKIRTAGNKVYMSWPE